MVERCPGARASGQHHQLLGYAATRHGRCAINASREVRLAWVSERVIRVYQSVHRDDRRDEHLGPTRAVRTSTKRTGDCRLPATPHRPLRLPRLSRGAGRQGLCHGGLGEPPATGQSFRGRRHRIRGASWGSATTSRTGHSPALSSRSTDSYTVMTRSETSSPRGGGSGQRAPSREHALNVEGGAPAQPPRPSGRPPGARSVARRGEGRMEEQLPSRRGGGMTRLEREGGARVRRDGLQGRHQS